ncbi:MAG: TusE/DsrC/DsvC family sulfur relay protein [Rhodobacteraceae bacterium]|nr:TusE/DsrC/DsvC family sulfur relay protein [Paracoccaceae bacterium]
MRSQPEELQELSLDSGVVECDASGYLTDPLNWSREFAEHVAREQDITLTDEHYAVIEFMRDFNEEHGVMADARFVLKFLAERHQTNKKGALKLMFDLFPYGYVSQACKIAGMKQPRAWSTG